MYIRLDIKPRLRVGLEDCSWEDILDLMVSSRREYEKKALGLRGILRRAWRKAGDNSTRIAPLFDMIPDDSGLTVLRGGLGWILTVRPFRLPKGLVDCNTDREQLAKEASKKREAIFLAFESIPEVFVMAAEKRRIFRDDGQLQERVADIHGTIVSSIMLLVSFLLPDHRCECPESKIRPWT